MGAQPNRVAGESAICDRVGTDMPPDPIGAFVSDLVVREVSGDHDALVLEPNVRVLATHIRRALDAWE